MNVMLLQKLSGFNQGHLHFHSSIIQLLVTIKNIYKKKWLSTIYIIKLYSDLHKVKCKIYIDFLVGGVGTKLLY